MLMMTLTCLHQAYQYNVTIKRAPRRGPAREEAEGAAAQDPGQASRPERPLPSGVCRQDTRCHAAYLAWVHSGI